MKKIIVLLVALLTLSMVTVPVFAENANIDTSIDVTITITNNEDGTFTVVIPDDQSYATLTPKMIVYNTGLTTATVLNETTSTCLSSEDVSVDDEGNVSFVVREGGTYVISDLISAEVTVAPAVNDLVYNGTAQQLVTAGECTNGTMMYSMKAEGEFNEAIPVQTSAGTYTVYYYAKGVNAKDSNKESVEVTIYKKTFDGTIPEPAVASSITFGQSIKEAGLTENGWVFPNGDFVPKNAGTYNATVEYAVSDADNINYSSVDGYNGAIKKIIRSVSITVDKADPESVTFPTLTAKYGDKLGDVVLPDGFTFADEVDTSATVGNASSTPVDVSVVYTPEDTVNYNSVTGTAKLTVQKADPESVTFPTLIATYGDTLADIELPSGFSFVETDLTKSVGNASETAVEIELVYTPADTDNYNSVTGKATLTVNKAEYKGEAPAVPELDPVAAGTLLKDVKLPTGYVWKDDNAAVSETAVAVYTPDANHEVVEVTIPLKVISTSLNSTEADLTVSVEENTPLTDSASSVITGTSGVKTSMTTEYRKELAEAIENSSNVKTNVEVYISDTNIKEEKMAVIEEKAGTNSQIVACVDIDVIMTVDTDGKTFEDIQLTELASPLTITVKLPDGSPTESEDPGKVLQYFIVLEHEGQLLTIPAVLNDDGTVTFSSRLFSTYAIAYRLIDKPTPSSPSYGGYVFPKTGVDK